MRWATAPTYTAYVIDTVGSAGLQSQACNEFEQTAASQDRRRAIKFVAHHFPANLDWFHFCALLITSSMTKAATSITVAIAEAPA